MRQLSVPLLLVGLSGCQSLDRFDTKNGAAYCGYIESSQFIWTPPAAATSPAAEGGFDRRLRIELIIDTAGLDSPTETRSPGKVTTDDADIGPCSPKPTFQNAPLRVTPEITRDALSLMTFEDGQVHNIIAWVDSTCRGTMLAIVSLYSTDRVDVRLLKPAPSTQTDRRDAFALFPLSRREAGCGY